MVSSGRHLISDTYTTIGIIAGLVLLYFTNLKWIDSAVATLFALIIIYTGYKIIRSSIAGIMDEADEELLNDMVVTLNENRSENWIDLHNIRIIKYGATLHLDGHLTIPWYFNVQEAHKEIDSLSELVKGKYGKSMELLYIPMPVWILAVLFATSKTVPYANTHLKKGRVDGGKYKEQQPPQIAC